MASNDVTLRTFTMHGENGGDPETDEPLIDLEAAPEPARFDTGGRITLKVEPSSVTAFELRRD
jgi:hypothetical protein